MLLTLAALFWGGNAIVGRWLRDYVNAVDINLIRWLLAFFILLPFCLRPFIKEQEIIRKNGSLILLLGILGVAIFQTLLYLAFQTTTAVNAVLILSACPVIIVLINGFLYREWLSITASLGVTISLIGTLVIISRGQWSILKNLEFYSGDLWMLLASSTWAIYSIALKYKPTTLSSSSLLFSTVIAGLCVLLPWHFIYEEPRELLPWSAAVYWNLLYLAAFASVLAFVCWNRGVMLIGASKAGVFMHLIPLFTAILSFFILKEGVTVYHLIGAALVFSGIALTSKKMGAR